MWTAGWEATMCVNLYVTFCAAHSVRHNLCVNLYVTFCTAHSVRKSQVRKLTSLGAELHLYGTDCLEAELAARAAADASGAAYVSPYNDLWVMAGQGTLALELLASRRRGQLDVVLVPVGGGGLIGGMASVLKAADKAIRVS